MTWISIDLMDENAQVPEDREEVLVYTTTGEMHVATYQHLTKDTRRGHHQFMETIEGYAVLPATHWMLLPEPPR